MIISNFLYRVRQYIRDNEARLIRLAFYILIALAVLFLIAGGVSSWQKSRYEKRIQDLDAKYQRAEADAKAHQSRADDLKRELDAKQAEFQFLEARAAEAEDKLRNARGKVVTLEKTYETIRFTPMPTGPVSCEDACAQLARLGYECR